MAAYNIGGRPLCWQCTRHSSAYSIRVVCRKRRFRRMSHSSSALTDDLLISDSPFMVGEKSLVPEVSVAFRTGDSKTCRYTLRARQVAAACLVTCVGHVATAPLAARFTNILCGHGCCQVPYHVIMTGVVMGRICPTMVVERLPINW